ncbi:MAG: malectin domain-containing carbohydrate-binding protein, partial [Pseudomonadota bacterium]
MLYELTVDHYSPLSVATYDSTTGELYLEFDYDRLLDTQGEWRNGRHIDAVTFMDEVYPIIIHADDGPRDENGRYIFDRDTVDNIFTLNVGAGHDPDDGTLDFALTDREDGTGVLYTFALTEAAPAPNQPPVTVQDEVSISFDETILVDVLANDSDPEGGALTLIDAFTETVVSVDVTVENNQIRLDPVDAAVDRIDTITYIVEDEQGDRSTGRLILDISGESANRPDTPTLVQAVNVGGDAFVAANGVQYEADTYNTGRTFSTTADIGGTTDDGLYQTEAWAKSLRYEMAVANGTYDLEMNFAEIWGGAKEAGVRVLDIFVEDQLIFNDLDLSSDVGFRQALDLV